MSDLLCQRTDEVLAAARTGSWSDALRKHAARCPACGDALLVETLLAEEGRTALSEAEIRMPDAGVVWRRVRLAERRDDRRREVERATLPIAVVQRIAWACGAAGGAFAVWHSLPVLSRWFDGLGRFLEWRAPHITDHGEAGLLAVAVLVLFGVLFGVYSEWAEG